MARQTRRLQCCNPSGRAGRSELALIQAAAGRYAESAAAVREMPAENYPAGVTEAAAKLLESAPARPASPESLPRLGNLGFAYLYVGAPERTLEFYEDEISGNYFQPISSTWFWHPAYRRAAQDRAVQEADGGPWIGRILACAWLARPMSFDRSCRLRLRVRCIRCAVRFLVGSPTVRRHFHQIVARSAELVGQRDPRFGDVHIRGSDGSVAAAESGRFRFGRMEQITPRRSPGVSVLWFMLSSLAFARSAAGIHAPYGNVHIGVFVAPYGFFLPAQ